MRNEKAITVCEGGAVLCLTKFKLFLSQPVTSQYFELHIISLFLVDRNSKFFKSVMLGITLSA